MTNTESTAAVSQFLPALVVLLQNAVEGLLSLDNPLVEAEEADSVAVDRVHQTLMDMNSIIACVLHDFRLQHTSVLLPPDLGWWVQPRSTTWFSQFVMFEFEDSRWIKKFRMSKESVIRLANVLAPHVAKHDTKFRRPVPVLVRVACTLYKLCQGASLLICSEMFVVGKQTVSEMLREVVSAINIELRGEIEWPRGNKLIETMHSFEQYCSLPAVIGAIDGTHFEIRKPALCPEDYYYFKSGGYSLQCQVVVDRSARFLDVSVGMPGSTYDVRVLKRSGLYHLATQTNLFDVAYSQHGFSPYLIGDKGYPLLPWLLTPYRDGPNVQRSYAERLFSKKLRKGRSVVEHAFGVLKQMFREVIGKSDLNVTFLLDVIVTCCLLHNLLLRQSHEQVDKLLEVLQTEGMVPVVDDDPIVEPPPPGPPNMDYVQGDAKKTALGMHLANRRAPH